jgi:outer membrane protein, multidrug efflux system
MLALLLALLAQAAPNKGLGLRDLQERARKNDPRAQQAAAQLENARAKRDEVSWAFFPTFQTNAFVGGPMPEHRLIGGDSDPEPTNPAHLTPGSHGDWFHGGLGVVGHIQMETSLPIFTFGKLTAGRKGLGHLVNASEAALQRARDQAAYDVARAYWGYQTARNADVSVQKTRDRIKQAQDTAKKLLADKSEQLTRSDAMKIDYVAEEVEAQHATAVNKRDLAIAGLRLLVGVQPGEPLEIAQQDLPDPQQPPNPDELLRRALAQRPETRAANEAVAGRQALVDLERAKLWPDFALIGGFHWTDTTNASNPTSPFAYNPYHEGTGFVALGMQVTFDIPQKRARVRQAEADLMEALALQTGAQQLVRLELQQALGDLAEARIRVERYGRETQIGKQLATQAALAFDSGLGEAREMLEDILLHTRADGERLRALYDAQLAWAALEKAAGAQLSP